MKENRSGKLISFTTIGNLINMETAIILLSTYNGEKYLKEQIDSIFSQKNVEIKLLVRDDGSNDNTLSILHDYKTCLNDKIEIIEGKNIGWRKSFFRLLDHASKHYRQYKYFAFSDQDDIWLPNKIERALHMFHSSLDQPSLYCSNLYYYKDGVNHGLIRNYSVIPTYKNCLVRNHVTGCTIVFNRELLDIIGKNPPQINIAHDYWMYMVAQLCGKVIIDDEAFILYRQHDNNQIGFRKGIINVWKRRLSTILQSFKEHERETLAKELLTCLDGKMCLEAKKSVNKIATYRCSLKNKLSLIFDLDYTLGKKSNDFWLRLRILFNAL